MQHKGVLASMGKVLTTRVISFARCFKMPFTIDKVVLWNILYHHIPHRDLYFYGTLFACTSQPLSHGQTANYIWHLITRFIWPWTKPRKVPLTYSVIQFIRVSYNPNYKELGTPLQQMEEKKTRINLNIIRKVDIKWNEILKQHISTNVINVYICTYT